MLIAGIELQLALACRFPNKLSFEVSDNFSLMPPQFDARAGRGGGGGGGWCHLSNPVLH